MGRDGAPVTVGTAPVRKTTMIAPNRLQERREPWDRQPGETPKSYEAFKAYLHLGPGRSLAAVRRNGAGRAEAWSSRHGWVRRAAAWDAHLEARAQREIEHRNTAARGAHHTQLLEIRHEALTVARQILREVSTTLSESRVPGGRKVSPRELADIARSVAEVARSVGAGTSADEEGTAAPTQVIDLSRLPAGTMVEAMRMMIGDPKQGEEPHQPAAITAAVVLEAGAEADDDGER